MASATPVGIAARPPRAAIVTSSRATRSAPASPGWAYAGSGRSGSSRTTGTSGMATDLRIAAVLVWMDLEMTGLDPGRHVIVEIATLVTDNDLQIIGDGVDLVVHQPAAALAEMEDVVRQMHTSSGLITEIEQSTISLEDAGAQTLDFMKSHV